MDRQSCHPRSSEIFGLPKWLFRPISMAAVLVFVLLVSGCNVEINEAPDGNAAAEAAPERTPNDWLFNLPDEESRLASLQRQLRGTDVAMWEIGERYVGLHEALLRDNFDLATYHWDKIKQSLDNAMQRRPARRASAKTIFLDSVWPQVRKVFSAGDADGAWPAFEQIRTACIACHEAENLAYMNDMPLFDLRAPGG